MKAYLPGAGAFTLRVMGNPIPIPAFPLKGKVDADLFLPLRGRTEVGVGGNHSTALIFRRASAADRVFQTHLIMFLPRSHIGRNTPSASTSTMTPSTMISIGSICEDRVFSSYSTSR